MTPALKIRLHLTSRRVLHFVQEDPAEATAILASVSPGQFFRSLPLTIAGEHSVSLLRAGDITWIEFLTETAPAWPHPEGIRDLSGISKELFAERTGIGRKGQMRPRVRLAETDETYVQWLRLEFAGGDQLHLEVMGEARTRSERVRRLPQLLTMPSLWATLPGQGAALINMANVAVMNLVPGVPEIPPEAWLARSEEIS